VKSRIVTMMFVVGLTFSGTTAVVLTSGAFGHHKNEQYPPGCGPKKSNGVNASGTHTGQPSKSPDRSDCPTAN
jgi:hypothetical protein